MEKPAMTPTKQLSLPAFSGLPLSYSALCKLHLPRTIHDLHELEASTEIIDLMAGHTLNADQEDYLSTLAELAHAYEESHNPPHSDLSAHEFLAQHLINIGMSASEWGERIGIDRSTASRLLRGERKLNTNHICKTADALHIAPTLLI